MRCILVACLLAACSGLSVKTVGAPKGLPEAVKTVVVRLDYPEEAYAGEYDKFLAAMTSKAPSIAWKRRGEAKGEAHLDIHIDWSREGEVTGRSRYVHEVEHPFGPGSGAGEHYDTGSSTSAFQNADVSGTVTVDGNAPVPFKYHLSIEERGNGFRADLYTALLKRLARTLAADLSSGRPALPSAKARGVQWVPIPGGTFLMGGGSRSNEKPRHLVRVEAFEMAKELVTFDQYQTCVAAGACTPAHTLDGTCSLYDERTLNWDGGILPETFEGDQQPVVCVDWAQAQAFSKWAGGRLPTEAEFEYAARGAGLEQKYPWGNEAPSCDRAVLSVGKNSCGTRKTTWPVCSKDEGNTVQGLCDMTGNASEWTQDWYRNSYAAPEVPGTRRVTRGASWAMDVAFAAAVVRHGTNPAARSSAIGFRPARSTSPKATIAP